MSHVKKSIFTVCASKTTNFKGGLIMSAKTSSLMKGLWACLLLLSFVSVLHAADDTRFTLKDGVIDDSKLGLQWVPAPDRAMNYDEALEYAGNLSLAGVGWRLPTIAELKSLYDKSKPGGADPKFAVSGKWVWSSEQEGPWWKHRLLFNFSAGNEGVSEPGSSDGSERVLAVRSRR